VKIRGSDKVFFKKSLNGWSGHLSGREALLHVFNEKPVGVPSKKFDAGESGSINTPQTARFVMAIRLTKHQKEITRLRVSGLSLAQICCSLPKRCSQV
jgi:hypothetical protein